jgi:uncharacterized phage protein gp47/JayE
LARTYATILTDLKNKAVQLWNKWNTAARHIGNVILECLSDQIEKIEAIIDAILNEFFPDTATQYTTLLKWARVTQYPVRSVQPAEVTLTLSISAAIDTNIQIPAGTRCTTAGPNPIPFETIAGATILAGETSTTIKARQTETKTETFNATGQPNQVFMSSFKSIWLNSIVVSIDAGDWAKVVDFLQSSASSTHYMAQIQEQGDFLLIFGDGARGKAPQQGKTINLSYKLSRGTAGNVGANMITIVDDQVYDGQGFLVDLKVNNDAGVSTVGLDQETITELKQNIPNWIITSNRCVTNLDFNAVLESVPGVARGLSLSKDEDDTIPALTIKNYIVPTGGGDPSEDLIDLVMAELTANRPKVLTVAIDVLGADYLTVDVTATVTARAGYTSTQKLELKASVEEAIAGAFDYAAKDNDGTWLIDFGKVDYRNRLIYIIMNVPGVANVNLVSPAADISPTAHQIPALGVVTVNVP